MPADEAVRLAVVNGVATVTLDRPARHNSLVPDMLAALNAALDAAVAARPSVLVLAASGRNFSTGGDVAAFAATARGPARHAYADGLVGALNDAILRLAASAVPVIARVQGAVTGGAAGLLFASDVVVMGEGAFLQPYYTQVGFAPDGGWTALLPDLVGARTAGAIQFANRRISAVDAVQLGLASQVVPVDELDTAVARWTAAIRAGRAESIVATRALLWSPERCRRLAEGLERERRAFLDLIDTDATQDGMRDFLETLG